MTSTRRLPIILFTLAAMCVAAMVFVVLTHNRHDNSRSDSSFSVDTCQIMAVTWADYMSAHGKSADPVYAALGESNPMVDVIRYVFSAGVTNASEPYTAVSNEQAEQAEAQRQCMDLIGYRDTSNVAIIMPPGS